MELNNLKHGKAAVIICAHDNGEADTRNVDDILMYSTVYITMRVVLTYRNKGIKISKRTQQDNE